MVQKEQHAIQRIIYLNKVLPAATALVKEGCATAAQTMSL